MPANKRQSPLLRMVLNSDYASEEREAATALAQAEGVSVSTMLRRLLRKLYRRHVKNYNPNLFADNHTGGTGTHQPGCTCVVCTQEPATRKERHGNSM